MLIVLACTPEPLPQAPSEIESESTESTESSSPDLEIVEQWRVDVGGRIELPVQISGKYVVVATEESLQVLDKDGYVVAYADPPDPPIRALWGGRGWVIFSTEEQVYSAEIGVGVASEWLWSAPSYPPQIGSTPEGKPVVSVYNQGIFLCIDGYSIGDCEGYSEPTPSVSPPWVNGEDVYYGLTNGLARHELDEWQNSWGYATDTAFSTMPVTSHDLALAVDELGDLHAVDLDLGSREWVIPVPGARGLVTSGSVAVVGQQDGLIRALSVTSGQEQWAFQAPDAVMGVPVIEEDTVYAASADGTVLALDLSDGTELWRAEVDQPVEAGVAVGQGIVYVATTRGNVLALSP